MALCSATGEGGTAVPKEKRCKKWTNESAEAGLGCTRVDGRASQEVLYLEEGVRRRLSWTLSFPSSAVRKISEQAEDVACKLLT